MKTFLSLVALTVLVSAFAFAQVGGGASAVALGIFTVGTALEISPSDGDFGDLAPGTTYQIAADGSLTPPDAGGNTEAVPVLWEIAGQPGASVLITFSLPPFFEGGGAGGGGARVPYSAGVQSGGWSDAAFAVGDPYNPIDPRVPNTIFLIAGGAAVQVGGVIAVPNGTPDDDYEAQFILTAAYTGL